MAEQLSFLAQFPGERDDANLRPARSGYRPPEFPDLSEETELAYDTEATGLRWYSKDAPCGFAIGTRDGRGWYFPTRHTGGNLPEPEVIAYLKSARGLAGKRLVTAKGSYDVHMSDVVGLDLEAIGCTITDVQHHAALLDDTRRELNLDSIARKRLGVGKKKLDVSRGAHIYHASEVEEYALGDVDVTMRSYLAMAPLLSEQGLDEVRQLEDACIFPTVEMERNGALIDIDKLERWIRESQQDFVSTLYELYAMTRMRVEPTEEKSVRALFHRLSIPIPLREYGDRDYDPNEPHETFVDQHLRKINHPAIHLLRRAKKLASLRSKYLLVFLQEAQRNGIFYEGGMRLGRIIYSLNQLRSDDGGTISGRYSSSAFTTSPREGINIQQVAGKKQLALLKELGLLKYNVRELFVPSPGRRWLRADAKQIEYRLFAHYARPARILAAYAANPDVDYHAIVMEMIAVILATITRERTKDLNFAMLFGAGVDKIAYMMGVTVTEARKFVYAYLDAFPEAKQLRNLAMETIQTRGWVNTLSGRRARYAGRQMLNSALNRIIQGSAADINKRKIIDVYAERKRLSLTMRLTVHDELGCDAPGDESAAQVKAILDGQAYDTVVPILWDVRTADNWARAA